MKQFKPLIVVLLAVLIIPSVAFASWWNPFSWNWNIFNWFSKPQTSMVQPNQNTPQNQNQNTSPETNANQATNQPSIKVLSPNNGDSLQIGKTYNIKWTSKGVGNVSIEMTNFPTSAYLLNIATNIANTGSYSWTIPAGDMGVDYPQNNGYVIRITSAVYPYTSGKIDNISLSEPVNYNAPDIKITSPSGGEQFRVGQDIPVKWTSVAVSKVNIRAVYYDSEGKADPSNPMNGGECRITYEAIPASTGSFTIVGGNTGRCGILPAGNKMTILITGTTTNGNPISDSSDYFRIVP